MFSLSHGSLQYLHLASHRYWLNIWALACFIPIFCPSLNLQLFCSAPNRSRTLEGFLLTTPIADENSPALLRGIHSQCRFGLSGCHVVPVCYEYGKILSSEDLPPALVPHVTFDPLGPGVVRSVSWLCGAHHAGFVLTVLSGLTAVGLLHWQIPGECDTNNPSFVLVPPAELCMGRVLQVFRSWFMVLGGTATGIGFWLLGPAPFLSTSRWILHDLNAFQCKRFTSLAWFLDLKSYLLLKQKEYIKMLTCLLCLTCSHLWLLILMLTIIGFSLGMTTMPTFPEVIACV